MVLMMTEVVMLRKQMCGISWIRENVLTFDAKPGNPQSPLLLRMHYPFS